MDDNATDEGRAAHFSPGQLVQHRMFHYRGVVVDVDATYQLGDDWYEQVARSRPPKNEPWYHVLVHGAVHSTYVAQRNLESDSSGEPIDHPQLGHFFANFRDGRYARGSAPN